MFWCREKKNSFLLHASRYEYIYFIFIFPLHQDSLCPFCAKNYCRETWKLIFSYIGHFVDGVYVAKASISPLLVLLLYGYMVNRVCQHPHTQNKYYLVLEYSEYVKVHSYCLFLHNTRTWVRYRLCVVCSLSLHSVACRAGTRSSCLLRVLDLCKKKTHS